MLRTVGYTTVFEEEDVGGVGYSRSATAWFEEREGTEVSDVALGTVLWEEMDVWSSVHQP
jgi:hypothetical protein